jgi:hypothetical protein
LWTEYLMRNEFQFETSFIEIIGYPNFRWFALENKYRFSYRASAYFAHSQGFVFQGNFELYLWVYDEGTTSKTRIYCMKIDLDHVFCHAVPLRTILSINAKSVWCHHHSLTYYVRTLCDSHEVTSPNHLSSPELICHISEHSQISPSSPHQNSCRFPQVSDRSVLTLDRKRRRNNYRLYNIINTRHWLALCHRRTWIINALGSVWYHGSTWRWTWLKWTLQDWGTSVGTGRQ